MFLISKPKQKLIIRQTEVCRVTTSQPCVTQNILRLVLSSERNLTYLKSKLKDELQTFISSRIPYKTCIAALGEFFKDLKILNLLTKQNLILCRAVSLKLKTTNYSQPQSMLSGISRKNRRNLIETAVKLRLERYIRQSIRRASPDDIAYFYG